MFPASMLAKLFVKGSLKNTETGFEFKLKNIIDSGTLVGAGPLMIDETTYPAEALELKVGEKQTTGDQITRAAPLYVRSFIEIQVKVKGEPLQPGEHKISLQMLTSEAGRLQFSITEPLAE